MPRKAAGGANPIIAALDYTALSEALAMARKLQGLVPAVKVGSALFTAHGPEAVARLKALGFGVMLDLKFFDIPSTVELSCRAAAGLGVALLTVHASGEPQMLEAAVRGAQSRGRRQAPKVLGVTVLTSVRGAGLRQTTAEVLRRAGRALDCGLDGVVAAAQEAAAIRRRFGRKPLIVCPGIRPGEAALDDQQRVATAAGAVASGADWLVIGRPITAAADPRQSVAQIMKELEAKAC